MRHNDMATRSLWCPILILLLLVGDGGWLSPASAQTVPPVVSSPPTPPAAGQDPPPTLPVNIDRIKGALVAPARVRIDDGKIRFYTETVAPSGPTFKELTVNFDLRNGPVPGAGMTHQEFLSMVTPEEASLYSPMLTTGELVTVAATSMLFAGATALITDGFQKWGQARKKSKQRAAKKEVDEAILEWEFANPRPAPSQ